MRHAGRFGRRNDEVAAGIDRHALRLDADRNFLDGLAGREIHDRDETVVFVGDIENFAVGRNVEEFRIGAGIELARHLERIGVDHGDLAIVAEADDDRLVIRRDDDAARTLAHIDRRHELSGSRYQ